MVLLYTYTQAKRASISKQKLLMELLSCYFITRINNIQVAVRNFMDISRIFLDLDLLIINWNGTYMSNYTN